jgi:hypothetical protein
VPAGIVCFFPSYEYENAVYEHWKKNQIISKLELKKKVGIMFLKCVKYSVVWLTLTVTATAIKIETDFVFHDCTALQYSDSLLIIGDLRIA